MGVSLWAYHTGSSWVVCTAPQPRAWVGGLSLGGWVVNRAMAGAPAGGWGSSRGWPVFRARIVAWAGVGAGEATKHSHGPSFYPLAYAEAVKSSLYSAGA